MFGEYVFSSLFGVLWARRKIFWLCKKDAFGPPVAPIKLGLPGLFGICRPGGGVVARLIPVIRLAAAWTTITIVHFVELAPAHVTVEEQNVSTLR